MHTAIGLHLIDRSNRPSWQFTLQYTFLFILFLALAVLITTWLFGDFKHLFADAACSMKGGKWTRVGMDGELYCIVTYRDAGKACHSSDECLGGCVIHERPVQGQPVLTGVCKDTSSPFGCFAYIEHPEQLACFD
jgi:hypothetical protein